MTRAFALAALLMGCSSAPDWRADAVEVVLGACPASPDVTPVAGLSAWNDGFGITFDDRAVGTADGCWSYEAVGDGRAIATLLLSPVAWSEAPGTDTVLWVDARGVMQRHAESESEGMITFVIGDREQSQDQDWSGYLDR